VALNVPTGALAGVTNAVSVAVGVGGDGSTPGVGVTAGPTVTTSPGSTGPVAVSTSPGGIGVNVTVPGVASIGAHL
jgi:hypothetical protein